MATRRSFAVEILSILLASSLVLGGCAALASFLDVAAPVAVAAIDAYTEHARAVAPTLPPDSPIVVELARLFADDDRCRAAVLALPVAADAGPSDAALVAQALEDSASATRALLAAVAAARAAAPPAADAGGE